jgi:tRNA/rRNA methyltransferase
MGHLRTQLDVVCHQIRLPENLGAVARLCANFGVARVILSDAELVSRRDAERVAVGSTSVLDGMKHVPTLEAALQDAVFALGTTGRSLVRGRRSLLPEEAVGMLWKEAARGRVALVLGGEQRGLSDDELERCHAICVIPTSPVQPSMNIAQAAAVLLYLCARADDERPTALHEGPAPAEGARMQTLLALEARMQDVLLRAEFLNPEAPEHILRELSRSLVKGQLSQREAELWLSAFAHLGRRCR